MSISKTARACAGATLALHMLSAISVDSAAALSFEFVRIVDTNTLVPGHSETLSSLGVPAVDGGAAAFTGMSPSGTGIFSGSGDALATLVDLGASIPGGTGDFEYLSDPSFEGGEVAFTGGISIATRGVYKTVAGEVSLVADLNTQVPGMPATFDGFGRGWLPVPASLDAGSVAFVGVRASTEGQVFMGIYTDVGGTLNVVVEAEPEGYGGPLHYIESNPSFDAGHVAALAGYGLTDGFGIFSDLDGSFESLYVFHDPVPNSPNGLYTNRPPSLSDGSVAFRGTQDAAPGPGWSIYTDAGGSLRVVTDESMPVPGGAGTFLLRSDEAGDPVIDAGNVAFLASDSVTGEKGLFVEFERTLLRVIDTSDELDGKPILDLQFGPEGLGGANVAFVAEFEDGSSGVFMTTVPEPSTVLLLALGLAGLAGIRRRQVSA